MKRFSLWVRWLKLVGFGLILFGLIMTFFNASPIFDLFNQGIDPVFWEGVLSEGRPVAFRTWVYGAWGATIVGWGITLVVLVHKAYAARERWSWYAIAGGLIAWYVLDSGVSAYFEVWFNVIFNSLILVLVLIPLVASYRYLEN